ncbi:MAG TPA: hypothetical protein VNZ52_11710 [Candidatus Thermoplasmatota archaeon]|nr:hypothetical protein [Candidatus Thermoplasmatota archaeon]
MAQTLALPYIESARFYPRVPELFWKNQDREMEAYNKVIYHLEHQATSDGVKRILDHQGAKFTGNLGTLAATLNRVLDSAEYPSAHALLEFKDQGIDLPTAVALLHFYRPAFPFYREEAAKSLRGMGFTVQFDRPLTEENVGHYEGYIAAIDFLKARIPFPYVPETNVFLSRLIEGALTGLARSS